MYAALDRPLVYTLYTSIKDEIEWMIRNKNNKIFPFGKELNNDPVFKLILQNNGCPLSDDPVYHEFTLKPDELNYKIIFMYGALGNKVNECFDYIEFFGSKILVIFSTAPELNKKRSVTINARFLPFNSYIITMHI